MSSEQNGRIFIFIPKRFHQIYSELPDVCRTEGRCHINSFRLSKGGELHRTDKAECHLRNMIRYRRGHQSNCKGN